MRIGGVIPVAAVCAGMQHTSLQTSVAEVAHMPQLDQTAPFQGTSLVEVDNPAPVALRVAPTTHSLAEPCDVAYVER